MFKILFDEYAYSYLREWAEMYRESIKYCPAFSKKTEVHFAKPYDSMIAIFESTGYGYKFALKDNNKLLFNGKLMVAEKDFGHDFRIEFQDKKSLDQNDFDQYVRVMQVCCTAFIHANAFLRLGNLLENRKYIAAGRNDGEDKIIVFRKYKDTLYAIPVGHHRSPEGVFGVRGHFRRYKNGKIIWIDEYLKGTEKETPQKE